MVLKPSLSCITARRPDDAGLTDNVLTVGATVRNIDQASVDYRHVR